MTTLAQPDTATPAFSMLDRVRRLEAELLKAPQVDLQTTNVLSGRMLARSIFIPAGAALTGATHRKDHINIVQGDISVSTDDGMKRLTGQHVLATRAGHKRVGYAHADTIWTTVVQTDLTDLAAIENEVVEEAESLQTRRLSIELESAPVLVSI